MHIIAPESAPPLRGSADRVSSTGESACCRLTVTLENTAKREEGGKEQGRNEEEERREEEENATLVRAPQLAPHFESQYETLDQSKKFCASGVDD